MFSLVAVASLVAFAALAADEEADGAISRLDVRVAEWNGAHMPTAAEWAARPLSWVGGFVGITIIVAVAAVALLWAGRRGDALILVVATLVAQAATHGPKAVFARPRPDVGSAVPLPDSYSFPSGHALTAVVVFGLLAAIWGRRIGYIAAAVLALAIGASRVVLTSTTRATSRRGSCSGSRSSCSRSPCDRREVRRRQCNRRESHDDE